MQIYLTLSSVLGGAGAFYLVLALLAAVLGAEIACIWILVHKMLRAKRAAEESNREESRYRSYHYAYALPIMLAAIPKSGYMALSVLAGVTAVTSVVLVVLLIVFRAKGYSFASSKVLKQLEENAENRRRYEEEEPAPVPYTAPEAVATEPLSLFSEEEAVLARAEESAPDAEEEEMTDIPVAEAENTEDIEEEIPAAEEEAASEEVPIGETAEEAIPAPAAIDMTVMPAAESTPAGDGDGQPVRVVEKVVTETYREVVKTEAAEEKPSSATDKLYEKLADYLDYQMKKDMEGAAASAAQENPDASVATFAASNAPAKNDDEDDDDEDDDDDIIEGEEGTEEGDGEESEEADTEYEGEDRFTGNERIIGFDDETGCYIVAHYRKSFEAKLIQARPNIKKYYSELKNALLAYKGTKSRISWTADSFHNGRRQIAKINVKTRILEIYFALDPASLEGTVYRGRDVGDKKKYSETPFQYKIRTPRKFKWAMELVQRVCEEQGLSPIDIEKVDYEAQYPFDTTDNLVQRKLIKEYIREEKPATSFELAPDHVPQVPEEDDSVIPANANFSWEFDNDRMNEAPEEPAPEIIPEAEEPQEEPAFEPATEEAPAEAPAPVRETVRETVRVTEVRYTEKYYANGQSEITECMTTPAMLEDDGGHTAMEEPDEGPIENQEADSLTEEILAEEEYLEKTNEDAEDTLEVEAVEEDTEEAALVDPWGDDSTEEDAEASEEGEEATEDVLDDEGWSTYESEQAEMPEIVIEEPDDTADSSEKVEEEYAEEAEKEQADYTEEVTAEQIEDSVEELYTDDAAAEEEATAEEEAEDAVEEASEEETEEAQPFRPSFYANRNYYDDTPTVDPAPRRVIKRPSANPSVAVVDICSIEEQFDADTVINLERLRAMGIVLSGATTLKIYATGELHKPFTVEANNFSIDAIRAISEADGDIVVIR